MNKELHTTQLHILKALLHSPKASFSQIQPRNLTSDKFTFHLKQLQEAGLINKLPTGEYALSEIGKEFTNRYDSDSNEFVIEKQAKTSVVVIASRLHGQDQQYLMQQRLKHPFYGFRGFITGKIKYGETVLQAAARELLEETGLSGTTELRAVYHERIYSKNKELLEDKYFYLTQATGLQGQLQTEFPGGKNDWIQKKDFYKENLFYDIKDLLNLIEKGGGNFSEQDYVVDTY